MAAALLVAGCSNGTSGGGHGDEGKGRRTTTTSAPEDSTSRSTPAEPELPASLTSQHLDWQRCRAAKGSAAGPGDAWRCATLKVPLNWSEPSGETIGLALIRAKATGGDRIGSLLFNFGGPGGSGLHMMPYYANATSALREHNGDPSAARDSRPDQQKPSSPRSPITPRARRSNAS